MAGGGADLVERSSRLVVPPAATECDRLASLEAGVIEMTIADKPHSRKKHRVSPAGLARLAATARGTT